MADEIELLRRFSDEIPGPSTDAWARARAAIAAARSEEEPASRRSGRGLGRRRRQVVIAAAAVILVAAGTLYGLTAGLGSAGHPAGAANELTAVNGCPGLAAAAGTLERVTGTGLVLRAPGGAPVTVITSASTKLSRQVAGTVSDITDGAYVVVFGTGSGGAIAARRIIISALPELSSGPAPPATSTATATRPATHRSRTPPPRPAGRGGRSLMPAPAASP